MKFASGAVHAVGEFIGQLRGDRHNGRIDDEVLRAGCKVWT